MQQRQLIKNLNVHIPRQVLIENDRWFVDIIIQVRREDASYAETILRKMCHIISRVNIFKLQLLHKEIKESAFHNLLSYCVGYSVVFI